MDPVHKFAYSMSFEAMQQVVVHLCPADHMQAAHPTMALAYFVDGEEEGTAVVKCFGWGC